MMKKRCKQLIVGVLLFVLSVGCWCLSPKAQAKAATETYDEVTVYDLYDLTGSFTKSDTVANGVYMGAIPQESALNTAVRYKFTPYKAFDYYNYFYLGGFQLEKGNCWSAGGIIASITEWFFGLCQSNRPWVYDDNLRLDLAGFGVGVGKEYTIEIGVQKKYNESSVYVANRYYITITGERFNGSTPLGQDTAMIQWEDTSKAEPGKHFYLASTSAPNGYNGNITYSTSHNLQINEEKGATCTEDGRTLSVSCSDCGHVFVESETKPAGHTASGWIIVDQATCTKNGLKQKKCVVCGYIIEEEIIQAAHTEVVDESVLATCTQTGLTRGSHCGVCGEVIIEQQIIPVNPDAHIINSNGIKKPTCAETGSYGVSMCIECGEVFDTGKTLPALGHDFSNWETNLETNKQERHCLNCGEIETKETTPIQPPTPETETKKGCGASVSGFGSLFAILPLFIGFVIVRKGGKKDEN